MQARVVDILAQIYEEKKKRGEQSRFDCPQAPLRLSPYPANGTSQEFAQQVERGVRADEDNRIVGISRDVRATDAIYFVYTRVRVSGWRATATFLRSTAG